MMGAKESREAHLNALVLILCIIQVDIVSSHVCTVGADYKFCHKLIAAIDAKEAFPLVHLVNTVHHCRDICDMEGCSGFQYHASANDKQQRCILFHGTYGSIQLVPNFNHCNDKEWMYSWKRPTERSNGHCAGQRPETLQRQIPGI